MTRKYYGFSVLALTVSSLLLVAPGALANDAPAGRTSDKSPERASDKPAKKDCDMTYTLKGWSAIYKTAKGEGTITCTNGETGKVEISVKGGGLTFGKTEIFNGTAEISGVRSIKEIYGSYASAAAHAGVVKAGEVALMTKGKVSLALAGSGEGVDVGIDFSKFTISKPGSMKDKAKSTK